MLTEDQVELVAQTVHRQLISLYSIERIEELIRLVMREGMLETPPWTAVLSALRVHLGTRPTDLAIREFLTAKEDQMLHAAVSHLLFSFQTFLQNPNVNLTVRSGYAEQINADHPLRSMLNLAIHGFTQRDFGRI